MQNYRIRKIVNIDFDQFVPELEKIEQALANNDQTMAKLIKHVLDHNIKQAYGLSGALMYDYTLLYGERVAVAYELDYKNCSACYAMSAGLFSESVLEDMRLELENNGVTNVSGYSYDQTVLVI